MTCVIYMALSIHIDQQMVSDNELDMKKTLGHDASTDPTNHTHPANQHINKSIL